ncbi:MAG: queuosine salvage family protein [Bacilli bacterium]
MLDKILSSCKYVVDNAKDVTINYSKIDELIKSTKDIDNSHWLYNSPFGILDFDVKDIVNFLLVYHSVGFSYWGNPKWTIKTENGELDGAYAMMYVLINQMKRDKEFLDADNLQRMTREELQEILKGNIELPLFNQRYDNLISIGKAINERMRGDFYSYIKDITTDNALVELIIQTFNVFNDVSSYSDKPVYFYKLAQLLVSDILHIRALKENINVDYTHLVGCADYKIPQVLRGMGMLKYSEDLSNMVDNKRELLPNSGHEIEIRASMLVAINVITEKLNNGICLIIINDFIWLKGQDKTLELKPYHLTRTKFY